jgi:signal transduction histidine kinase
MLEKNDVLSYNKITMDQEFPDAKQTEQALQDSLQKLKLSYQQAIVYARELTAEIVERKQAEEQLRRYAERLRNLREIDRDILEALSPAVIAQTALKQVRQLIPCQRANITLFDFEAQEAVVFAADVEHGATVQPGIRQSLDPALVTHLEQGKLLVVEDTLALVQPSLGVKTLLAKGIRSYIDTPLVAGGTLIGILSLAATSPDAFSAEHVEVASELASHLAIAIQQARLHEEVRLGRERLEALSHRLVEAQEAERRHIARELHDEIGQTLTAVKISLQAIERQVEAVALASHVAESIHIVEQAIQQVRNLSLDLRPSLLDDLGLVATLRWYLARQAEWTGFAVQFSVNPPELRLSPELETVCFRIVQEALTNIARHAGAQQVWVELQQRETELHLSIRDNGTGFDVEEALDRAIHGASLGLLSMQERASLLGGQLEIDSVPGHGVEIRARFPLRQA